MNTTGYNSLKSWGIAVACSFLNFVVNIPVRVAAMLFVAFLDRYDTDRQNATLFVIISLLLKSFSGPLTGYLGEIFELRTITVVGCFLASLGVAICFFAEDIIVVTIFLGVMYGTGVALSSCLLPQILKQHFTENIAMAVGVTHIGNCLGGFVIIPVMKIFLNSYGVSGSLLIISGIMLHGVPVAMLLRNPKYKRTQLSNENDNIPLKETLQQRNDFIFDSSKIEILQSSNEPILQNKVKGEYRKNNGNLYVKLNVRKTETNQMDNTANNVTISNIQPLVENKKSISISLSQLSSINEKCIEADEKRNKSTCCCMKADEKYKTHPSNCMKRDSTLNGSKQSKYRRALESFVVFKDPSYLVIMICLSATVYVAALLYTTIIDVSRDKGIPHSQEHFFLMLLPLAETIGYTCLGWTTDKGYVSVSSFMAISVVCVGVSCCMFAIANNFLIFMIATMVFGISLCGVSSVSPSLIYAFIDEKRHTMAITSRTLLYVPFSFTLGPLIGYFRGTRGSYDGVLYLLTAICIGCAILLMLLPCISRCTKRKL